MQPSTSSESAVRPPPGVNRVAPGQPLQWLRAGWRDLRAAPGYSLRYGAGIVLISLAITVPLALGRLAFLVPFLLAAFYLVAPLLAIGLYQMSAHLEAGESLERCQALEAFRRNQGQLGIATGFLLMILQLWILATVFLFIMLFTDPLPSWERFVAVVFLSGDHLGLVAVLVAVGAVFAAAAFCIAAVTVPMLIDRPVDAFTAARTSFAAVRVNWAPMLLWAGLIVVIVGLGLASLLLGLFVAVPLLGHATWHAYRDLVPRD
ncbi:DUF2189 domain-containing protein [Marichromatium sp. AB32]|uniref:DUF2189 domain-containing protein n=1 Tax=Marichromatium sp. AB32 TaxID=2483363 RepID=UPI000F3E2289|nr:DUF2189 domain-containing protein [Marichromatium sp. AB32]RNE92647.1 DUF2189 domain-containing protein [Marichromatium sp. AB32]